jgi:hypothetical protein
MTTGEERKEHDNARLLWSDKGYVHCEVRVIMGTCDNCGAKSLDPGSEKINVAPLLRVFGDELAEVGRLDGLSVDDAGSRQSGDGLDNHWKAIS